MRNKLIEFLKALERSLPPPDRCHHVLMYGQYGSDVRGWADRLLLQVNSGGRFYPFVLEDGELEKPSAIIVAGIVPLMKNPPSNWQISDTAGRLGEVSLKEAA